MVSTDRIGSRAVIALVNAPLWAHERLNDIIGAGADAQHHVLSGGASEQALAGQELFDQYPHLAQARQSVTELFAHPAMAGWIVEKL